MKKRKFEDVIIDLTSLLDVVFILLLVVITQVGTIRESASQKRDEAQQIKSEAELKEKEFDQQLGALGRTSEFITFVAVVSNYDEERLVERNIVINYGGEKEDSNFVLKGNGQGVDEVFLEFENTLKEYIGANAEKLVVLSLNEGDEDILYRDERRIKEVFSALSRDNANVRILGEEK